MADHSRSYTAVVVGDGRRVLVPVSFDPDEVWGKKREHRVHGTVNGMGVRAVVEPLGDGHGLLLGPCVAARLRHRARRPRRGRARPGGAPA